MHSDINANPRQFDQFPVKEMIDNKIGLSGGSIIETVWTKCYRKVRQNINVSYGHLIYNQR